MPSTVADHFAALLRADAHAPLAWTPAGPRTRADVDALAAGFEARLDAVPERSRVGLCLRDGTHFLAAFLAVARRGDAAVLLDAADPRAPRLDVCRSLDCAAVVVDHPTPDVVRLAADRRSDAGPFRAIKLTSGSTGQPTAVGVGDAELLADCDQLERTMGIGDGDAVFAAVPMSFSYGVGNLLIPALARGRRLVLPAAGPIGLLHALRAGEPTVLPAVPALLRALLGGSLTLPASLRLVLSAGAVLPPDVARAFRARFGLPVHTFYGATESGGICYDPTGTAAERGAVGAPVDGVAVEVGDDGRVRVRSAAVGAALGDADNPRDGLFVAPDLGELRDGELVLRGRAGAVFDVGGHKVDPREVERLLREADGVDDAAVLPWRDEAGRAACGAVVARDAGACDGALAAALRRHLAGRLPAAKVPRRFAFVEALPRCARGKLRREALEALLAADAAGDAGGSAP